MDALSVNEKKKLLENEYNIYQINRQLIYDIEKLNEKDIIHLLSSVMNAKSNHQVTQDGKYPAKKVEDIFKYSNLKEDEFIEHLKIIFLNDYLEYFKFEEFDINKDSEDIIYENYDIDTTHQLRFNLHRLYRTNNDQFNEELYNGREGIGSESQVYNDFIFYGSIVEKICSFNTLIRLSDKGMHYLHFVTSKRSTALMYKQEETMQAINEAKNEQSNILKTFKKNKEEQDKDIKSINSLIKKHSDKIKNFYKDITTILSIMVAAFAVIGVNISAIPKIESNFTANVLVMNLSLILCLLILFYILRVVVYDASINKQFYLILAITCAGIIGVFIFLGYYHESKIDVIENQYKELLEEDSIKNAKILEEMRNQIEQLEGQLEKLR